MAYPIQINRNLESKIKEIDFSDLPFGRHFTDHLFVADYANGHWGEGKIMPFQDFNLHPATSALHYGQAIFEGLKAQRSPSGEILLFRPDMNFRRMNVSAERMAMPAISEEMFFDALDQLIGLDHAWVPSDPGSSLYIRPFMFATEKYVGIKVAEHYRFSIFCCPVGKYYSKPVKVYIHDEYVRAFPGGVGFAKAAGNYGAALMPARQIQALGYDQILWLDGIHHKYLQEIGTMNVFLVIGDTLLTPPLNEGTILNGVTRDSVLHLALEAGIKTEVRDISVDEVLSAWQAGTLREAFGAGTAAGVAPIGEIFYKGHQMLLPEPVEGSISFRLKNKVQNLKAGLESDVYGWMRKITPLH
jgi:branched-chain amino acid aminotransferase